MTYELLPPTDPRVLSSIAPFDVETFKKEEKIKEGCLTFSFLFLDIKRPSAIKVKYLDENLKEQEEEMIGIVARCFLHEYDHMQGIVFTEKVTKFKLDYALKKRDKEIKRVQKLWQAQSAKN